MSLNEILTAIGSVAALVIIVAGLYAVFRSSSQDARIKRLQDERDDYLSRLNYIEPKFVEAEQQNKLLRSLQNPTAAISDVKANTDKTIELLEAQELTLRSIDSRLPHGGGSRA